MIKKKKIIVTGGTGFLGKALCYKLKSLNYNVTAIGRNIEIGKELEKKEIEFVKLDLSNKNQLEKALENIDVVIHCAAKSSLWGVYNDFYNVNVIGTKNIIEAANKNNVERLIYVSSPTIYYDDKDLLKFKNVNYKPENFINNYAETKWLAQHEIDKAFRNGLNTVSIIPRGIFGPGDTSIFPRLLKVNNTFGIPLMNNGSHKIDLTYIDNVVDALILAIDSTEKTFGQKYFITNDKEFVFKDLIEEVFNKLDVKIKYKKRSCFKMKLIASSLEYIYKLFKIKEEPPITKYSVEILYRNQTFDISRAKEELGYEPKISVEEGIDRFKDWWNKNDK